MKFKTLLKSIRKSEGCSQTEFGKIFGIGQQGVSDLETGKNKPTKTLLMLLRYRYSDRFIEEEQKDENEETLYKLISQEVDSEQTPEDHAHNEDLSFGNAVEKLRDIYSTKDPMIIHTINTNLLAFSRLKALCEALPLKVFIKDRRVEQRRKNDLDPPAGMGERRSGEDRRAYSWPPDDD